VLAKPKGGALARETRSVTVSLDLWEERFTLSSAGPPKRSIAHLRAPDAEAWCLDTLTVPLSAFARQLRDAPFWVRLEYRVADQDAEGPAFTLRSLIDRLSRRPQNPESSKALEGGPFRLTN
jgi:hypothetical protein